MKVLMLDPINSNPYGPDLATALSEAGVDIRLFVPVGFTNRERAKCATRHVAPRSRRGQYLEKAFDECRYVYNIWRTCRDWQPDIAHIQWLRFPTELLPLRVMRPRTRLVVTIHNAIAHEPSNAAARTQRELVSLADGIVVHEVEAGDLLVQTLGVQRDKVVVIPHGVHLTTDACGKTRQMAREYLGLPEEEPLFFLFGGVRPYKGHDVLLRAFTIACERGLAGRLVFAGWGRGAAVEKLSRSIAELPSNVRERTHTYLGSDHPVSEEFASTLFLASDCVVLPYQGISHSGVLAQAFGAGRPVLATRVGGFKTLVREGENGMLFEPGDVHGLADLLMKVGQNRAMTDAMGVRALGIARGELAWARIAERTIACYEAVLAR